jgi:uncharacterized protein (DUF58 family)
LRRLHLHASGRWYVLFTIALGVVALASNNNVLFLIESLLLSGLIFSGILSERTVSAVEVHLHRRPAVAGAPSRDSVLVTNHRRFTVFCLEIGEWRDGRFHPLAYVPRLAPRSTASFPAHQTFENRGLHHWDALAIATSYPFGFARKSKLIPEEAGERLIWPALNGAVDSRVGDAQRRPMAGATEPREGEIRTFNHDDDYRSIVWTLSAKGGDPLVRARGAERKRAEVTLDLRGTTGLPEAEFEAQIRIAARPFHELDDAFAEARLVLVSAQGKRGFNGRIRALDALARVNRAGEKGRSTG